MKGYLVPWNGCVVVTWTFFFFCFKFLKWSYWIFKNLSYISYVPILNGFFSFPLLLQKYQRKMYNLIECQGKITVFLFNLSNYLYSFGFNYFLPGNKIQYKDQRLGIKIWRNIIAKKIFYTSICFKKVMYYAVQ